VDGGYGAITAPGYVYALSSSSSHPLIQVVHLLRSKEGKLQNKSLGLPYLKFSLIAKVSILLNI